MIASGFQDGESAAASGGRHGNCGAGRKVLIVEDETLVARHLEAILQDLGFEVCEIMSTGKDAVIEAAAATPDIIFMDVNLAGEIDGVEAAKQILEKSDVTIIFVTAYSDDAPTVSRIRTALGDKIVLGKPVTPAAIRTAMLRL